MSSFEDLLAQDGRLVYKTRGRSMEPMLRQDRDLVIIRPPAGRLRRYDTALYRRGGNYVLHRVIRDCGDHYLIRGDNTYRLETVPDAAVIGVLTAFVRKGKTISADALCYRLYARLWCALFPVRSILRPLAVRAHRLYKTVRRSRH